ncbi:hypothetical protein [Thalassotalea sp. ND16A]|uniref:hypothetical protein n=1 Tax=Thalassotalea sp. ND16A TaxID=1535422 RepID=UPI00051D3B6F|nr:hypothetical protein [Thalassotalea sp. ND16A]KGJ99185.1 hypothetical protein ND16A_3949 [Thalassotalea sp. ND16A]
MQELKNRIKLFAILALISLLYVQNANGMGMRSLVALPIDKGGYVIRFSYESLTDGERDVFISSAAYGLTKDKALLIGMPYQITPGARNRVGDFSVLYRHTVLQDDFFSGTSRFALLGGVVVPSDNDREPAIQAGFVYTLFKNKHEFDIDVLYREGIDNRPSNGQYDLSWQYRLSPSQLPDWGIVSQLNTVAELNGRWQEGNEMTNQVTLGLQWVHPRWVIEGGVIKNITNNNELSLILSTRFHF